MRKRKCCGSLCRFWGKFLDFCGKVSVVYNCGELVEGCGMGVSFMCCAMYLRANVAQNNAAFT